MDNQPVLEFSPAEFVSILNQTLEYAYSRVVVVGELSSFRVARGKWVYFDLKDDEAKVSFFGSVFALPGPLEDGMMVRAVATPRMHQQFGFTLNFRQLQVAGEGSLKKAADLLAMKLEKEGLFDAARKRQLPAYAEMVAVVSAAGSAAESDFNKVALQRWPSLKIALEDALVQGTEAAESIVAAISRANQHPAAEIIVITRGGGSADDLAAFNDERVVRAIAASRLPTVVAIGHENDLSLAEMVADKRASTPTDAAVLVAADAAQENQLLQQLSVGLRQTLKSMLESSAGAVSSTNGLLQQRIFGLVDSEFNKLELQRKVVESLDPLRPLRQGYGLVTSSGKRLFSVKNIKPGTHIDVRLADGTINAKVEGVK